MGPTKSTTEHKHQQLSRGRIITATSLFAGGLAVTLAMYFAAMSGASANIDQAVLAWLVAHRTPEFTLTMEFVTNLLSPIVFALAVIIGSGLWAWKRREVWRPVLLVVAMAVTFVIAAALKEIVDRSRPPIDTMIPPFEIDLSFPSGHTIGIAALTLIIGYLIYSRHRRMSILVSWLAVFFFSTAIVALSRMYLGYHWITDVTASVGLAVMVLAGVIILDGLRYKYRLTKAVSDTGQ